MSKSHHLNNILAQAREKEKKYDWTGATDLYDQALREIGKEDFLRKGEIHERIGYCLYRAAYQAERQAEFKRRMQLAADFNEKATELFDSVEGLEKLAKTSHCKAMVAYVNSWLAADLSAKRQQLNECWRLGKEALRVYQRAENHMKMGKTCNRLMIFLTERLNIEWNAESREKIVEEALEYGEKAREVFSEAQDMSQLAEAYILTAFFCRNAAFAKGFNAERREECRKKALGYLEKAIEVSEEIGDAYLLGLSNLCLADARLDILGTTGLQERQLYEKALQCGTLTKDNLLIADALHGLEFATNFSAMVQDDPDEAREEYRKLDKYGEDAVRRYSLVVHDSGIAMAYVYMINPMEERSGMETNLESKRLLIEKSVDLGYRALDHARLSGSMGATFHTAHALGIALVCLARIETDIDKKRSLLKESAKHSEQSIDILKEASAASLLEPKEGNLAVNIWDLAMIQVELANMEDNIERKIEMLKNAITNMGRAREYWRELVKSPWARVEKLHWFIEGRNEINAGKTLNQLYTLTGDSTFLRDSVDTFRRSVDACDKANLPSLVAEAYWQIAKTYSQLVEYVESAKNFESASKSYRLVAEKIPQLKEFYMDYALYMEAWSEIEKARGSHTREEYGKAKEHYEKAADLHKSTDRWNYLSLNYLAWTRLEEAEDLSRREQTQEAKDLFQKAASLFVEAKKSIQAKLEEVESEDEREMLVNLAKASDIRREYCLGRIDLEEAKIFDRQGDHVASSRKYGSAAERFQKATDATEHELDRQELRPIVCLCRAWQMMTRAEAEASPNLYMEASQLFDEAKEHSVNEKATVLALGHSSFCKALEAGTRFEATRNPAVYSTAKKHIEAATNYYLKAGFNNASEYAKATYRLFDAYMYTYKAQMETDPEKKAKFYQMAEKLLQASAGSYMKAKYPEKSEEVRRLLESVKEERQFAVSLSEVLHAPTMTSATTSFSTPTPTQEQAVGLERFEHADIQANLILRAREVKVGDAMDLEIELVNAGKAPASLIKVEELVPEGFEIKGVPEVYRVEDRYLNMKGKRLNPLKTEEVKIVIKPMSKGMFTMKPRIVYLDEAGKYKSHEPEPVTITVKELGISGWIRGER